MNARLAKFSAITGENWLVGRYLLPKLEELGFVDSGIVLDLACGSSPFRRFFPNASKYIRIDLRPLDERVIPGSMLAIPLENAQIDTILLFQAISDVPRPGDVLVELQRVLKPQGRVLLLESMCYPEHDLPHDYFRILPAGLAALSVDSGMKLESVYRLGGIFTRFAMLWNSFVMAGLARHRLLRPLSIFGIVAANVVFYGLERLWPHPRLASDYLAVLRNNREKNSGDSEVSK